MRVATVLARSRRVVRQAVLRFGTRFRRSTKGSAVVEFSLIAPAMLLIYCALGELGSALETSRKTANYTRTIADLVGRSQVTDLTPLFDAASVILQPFDANKASIRVSAMGSYKVGSKYYAVVCSSAARNTTARSRFDFVSANLNARLSQEGTAPPAFQSDKARFILAEVRMPFTPVLGSVFFKWINQPNVIVFNEAIAWPERTDTEIVLPGGSACP